MEEPEKVPGVGEVSPDLDPNDQAPINQPIIAAAGVPFETASQEELDAQLKELQEKQKQLLMRQQTLQRQKMHMSLPPRAQFGGGGYQLQQQNSNYMSGSIGYYGAAYSGGGGFSSGSFFNSGGMGGAYQQQHLPQQQQRQLGYQNNAAYNNHAGHNGTSNFDMDIMQQQLKMMNLDSGAMLGHQPRFERGGMGRARRGMGRSQHQRNPNFRAQYRMDGMGGGVGGMGRDSNQHSRNKFKNTSAINPDVLASNFFSDTDIETRRHHIRTLAHSQAGSRLLQQQLQLGDSQIFK